MSESDKESCWAPESLAQIVLRERDEAREEVKALVEKLHEREWELDKIREICGGIAAEWRKICNGEVLGRIQKIHVEQLERVAKGEMP